MPQFRKLLLDQEALVNHDFAELRGYQIREAIPFLMDNPFSGLFAAMGLGKTVSVLTVLQRLFTRGAIRKVLIVAPVRVAVQTWPREIREWSHTWWMSFTVIRADEKHPELLDAVKRARLGARSDEFGSPNNAAGKAKTAHIAAQKGRLAQSSSMIHIINREALEWLVAFFGKKWPYDCVIIDESTSFSDHTTQRWRALNKVRPLVQRMHLLSGIPGPEGIQDYFAQIYLLDRGERFGRYITHFRNAYLDKNEYSRKYTPKEGANRKVAEKIADICMVMREEDYLDRPKALTIERRITLDRDELDQYKRFTKEFILDLPDVEIEAENASALAQKLLQLASGAVYDADKKWHVTHNHKIEELKQLHEEAAGSPLLVAYWHKPSLQRIMKAFPKSVKMDREGTMVDKWNAGKIDMLLVHPRSAGHGLNMQHGPGHTLVWFDNPQPLEDYLQTNKRLDRPGQNKIVRIYHLVTEGTIDTVLVPRLREKDDAQDAVRKYIRDLRETFRK